MLHRRAFRGTSRDEAGVFRAGQPGGYLVNSPGAARRCQGETGTRCGFEPCRPKNSTFLTHPVEILPRSGRPARSPSPKRAPLPAGGTVKNILPASTRISPGIMPPAMFDYGKTCRWASRESMAAPGVHAMLRKGKKPAGFFPERARCQCFQGSREPRWE